MPGSAAQQRPTRATVDGAVDRAPDRWRQRDKGDLVALAAHTQDPVPVNFLERLDVSSCGFEDAKPEESEHGDESEVVDVR